MHCMYIQITPRSHSGAISQHTNVLAILQHGGLSLQDFHALVNGTRTTIYCFPCYKSLAHFVKTVLCSYDGCLTQLLHHRCLSKLIHLHTYVGTVPHAGLILFLPSVLVPDILVICLSRLFLSRKRTTITYISRLLGCTFSYVVNVYNCL